MAASPFFGELITLRAAGKAREASQRARRHQCGRNIPWQPASGDRDRDLACDRIGLVADLRRPEAIGLLTTGGGTASRPVALDPGSLRAKLARTGLVIVPGFVGIGEAGQRTLIERGGSDGVEASVRLRPLNALGVADLPRDERNCLFLETGDGTRVSCIGRVAGGAATAEAVVADLYDLAALPRRAA